MAEVFTVTSTIKIRVDGFGKGSRQLARQWLINNLDWEAGEALVRKAKVSK